MNQARYIREFVQKAHEQQWQYNIIEAIDQPWKRSLEGTVGGYWGLMTSDLQPKFSLIGDVVERQDGKKLIWLGLVGALILLTTVKVLKEQRPMALIGLATVGALMGIMVYLKVEYIVAAARDWVEWLALGGLALLGSLMLLMQPWLISGHCARVHQGAKLIKLIFVYAAVVTGYLIFFDGRYRDFPIMLFAIPALVMALDLRFRPTASVLHWVVYAIPAALSVMFAALCVEKELNNHSATLWFMLSVLLAAATWPRQR